MFRDHGDSAPELFRAREPGRLGRLVERAIRTFQTFEGGATLTKVNVHLNTSAMDATPENVTVCYILCDPAFT
jgi:hypothetical protein